MPDDARRGVAEDRQVQPENDSAAPVALAGGAALFLLSDGTAQFGKTVSFSSPDLGSTPMVDFHAFNLVAPVWIPATETVACRNRNEDSYLQVPLGGPSRSVSGARSGKRAVDDIARAVGLAWQGSRCRPRACSRCPCDREKAVRWEIAGRKITGAAAIALAVGAAPAPRPETRTRFGSIRPPPASLGATASRRIVGPSRLVSPSWILKAVARRCRRAGRRGAPAERGQAVAPEICRASLPLGGSSRQPSSVGTTPTPVSGVANPPYAPAPSSTSAGSRLSPARFSELTFRGLPPSCPSRADSRTPHWTSTTS